MPSSSKSLIDHIQEHHHRFHFFFVLILATSISLGIYIGSLARAQTQTTLPTTTHPMWLTYYLDDSFYGNFRSELDNTVNAYLIWHYYMNAGSAVLDASFQDAVSRGKNIIFGPDFSPADTILRPSVDSGLDVARNYWNNIVAIYFDEPGMNKAGVEALINDFNSKVTARGLPLKPIAINFTEGRILNGTGYQAVNIDYVGLEAFIDSSLQNDPNLVNITNNKIDQQKALIGNRPMFIVIQGYDRNGAWTNLTSLKSIQTPAYLKSFNDSRVRGLFIFSYARPGGTRSLNSCIRTEHLRMWGAISGTSQPASISCSGASPTTPPPTPTPTPTLTPTSIPTPTPTSLPTYTIEGWVFDDADGDTIWDGPPSEPGWGGRRIYIHDWDWDPMVTNTTTDPGPVNMGYFAMVGIPPGNYNLTLEPADIPAGYSVTTGPNPFSITIGSSNIVHNFGLYKPSFSMPPFPSSSPFPSPSFTPPSPVPSPSEPPGPAPQSIFDSFSLLSVPKILSGLACYFIRFALILVGIAVILSGIIFIFSRGNPTAFANAKKNLLYVVIGGLVIYGVYTIILSVSLFVTGSTTLPWIPFQCP